MLHHRISICDDHNNVSMNQGLVTFLQIHVCSNRPGLSSFPTQTRTLALFLADNSCFSGIISCDGFTKYSGSFSEDYCWTQGLYTIKEAYDHLAVNVPYPGRVGVMFTIIGIKLQYWGINGKKMRKIV